jgi:hypothetical protein
LKILILIPVVKTTGYTTLPLRGGFHVIIRNEPHKITISDLKLARDFSLSFFASFADPVDPEDGTGARGLLVPACPG